MPTQQQKDRRQFVLFVRGAISHPGEHQRRIILTELCEQYINISLVETRWNIKLYSVMQEQLMNKVDETDQENQVLRQAGEQKDKEIRQLQSDLKATRKSCDAEVGPVLFL